MSLALYRTGCAFPFMFAVAETSTLGGRQRWMHMGVCQAVEQMQLCSCPCRRALDRVLDRVPYRVLDRVLAAVAEMHPRTPCE